jgi:hypothetical protein
MLTAHLAVIGIGVLHIVLTVADEPDEPADAAADGGEERDDPVTSDLRHVCAPRRPKRR